MGSFNMEKRKFGQTGMSLTAMGYGAMELRQEKNHENAGKLLNTALDCGINFVDTSPDYGMSEELIGRHVSNRRSEFYLATKCGCNLSSEGAAHIFTREQFAKNLEESLRRLNTDYIDLWQMHCVTPPELAGGKMDDSIAYMKEMQQKGYVRHIGISFKNGKATDAAYPTEHQKLYAKEMADWGVFDSIQMVYGALTRVSEDAIEYISNRGMAVIARGVLQRYFDYYREIPEKAKLFELFDDGDDLNAFLIRFALATPGISTMIIGSGSSEHIAANAKTVAKGALSTDVFAEAKRRLDGVQMM